jgi:signal transduction histidine kinase
LQRSITVTAAFAAVTVAVILNFLHVPYAESQVSRVVLSMLGSLLPLLVAYLAFGRFRQLRRTADLALVTALALLGFTNLLFGVVPLAVTETQTQFSAWSTLVGRLIAGGVFALAALTPVSKLSFERRGFTPLLILCAGPLAVIASLIMLLEDSLPNIIEPGFVEGPLALIRISGHPLAVGAELLTFSLFAVSAIAFTLRAERHHDELMQWFGVGFAFAAVGALDYALSPTLYTLFIHAGDFLHLAFYLFLAVGAGREILGYWQGISGLKVLEERRRLARDLHDGLAQELVHIWSQSRRLAADRAEPELEHIATGAERALDESRRAIAALTRPMDEPLDVSVAQAAEEVAHRAGVSLSLELAEGIAVEPELREELLRIVREAVGNAVRHGRAGHVTVSLADGPALGLSIADDGAGFDLEQARRRRSGFGLTGMEERVNALGGSLRIESAPGQGTTVKVEVPTR